MIEHKYITRYCADCGYPVLFPLNCGDRLCELCKKPNFFRLLRKYSSVIRKLLFPDRPLKHLTLTFKNQQILTPEFVEHMADCLNRLTKTKFWRSKVQGSLSVHEVKHKSDLHGWNSHYHCLVDACYIPQRELSLSWYEITGDSSIVDIRKTENSFNALYHLLKYFLKTPIIQGSDIEQLRQDYNDSFRGRRNIIASGRFYNTDDGLLPFKLVCPRCGSTQWINEFELFCYSERSEKILVRSP